MSLDNYMNSHCPGISGGGLSSRVPQRRSLLAKPLKERFKTWFLENPHQLHRFDTLRYLAADEPIEEVLAVLQEVALLVQGLWIIRTSLCTEIGNSDVRKYVLFLFSKDVIVRYDRISKAVEQFLPNLARNRPIFKDWKHKELPDSKFMELYPAIVKKQQEQWEGMEKLFDRENKRHAVKTPKSGR
ncbi:uncharacterized protein LOC121805051 [Salvia splendens]|uniref:uncharacterized protein LOC121805051 n=1 Tax=Salvia splendens TaxID=180675 RepID=UPI001C2543DD|nr:uncharacterized protein LOC121805051 [Salvia splendens]